MLEETFVTPEDAKNLERREAGIKILELKLEEFEQRIDKRLSGFVIKILIAFTILGITSIGAAAGAIIALGEIQDQRYNSLLESCQDQNQRNLAVNDQINQAVQDIPPEKQTKEQKQGTAAFKLIISAAVPYTPDCEAFANERVKGD